ncbi:MAG: hypothetical protein AAB518_02960 [Patescibacteria group bacterium]
MDEPLTTERPNVQVDQKLEPGDLLCIAAVKRGAPSIKGALIAETQDALTLMCDRSVDGPFTTIPKQNIATVTVIARASHAIFLHSKNRFEYGVLIEGNYKGYHFFGEVVAAWEGTIAAQTPHETYFKIRTLDAFLA